MPLILTPKKMNFLSSLAHRIVDNHNSDYQNIAIILPNKRAQQKLYLEMAALVPKPVFAPVVLSMDELVQELSPLELIDAPEQLVELFQVYRHCDFCNDDSFVSFMNWARTFLRDIDEIDQYQCDATQIFSNLANIKELDFFGSEQLTANQQKYLDFYYHLKELYAQFKQRLFSIKKGYKGMIYRDVVENIESYAQQFSYRKIIFAGLLALSPTEQKIARYFRENAEVEFLFDLDKFYFENEKLGIQKMVDEVRHTVGFEKIELMGDDFRDVPKEISITGATQAMGQVYAAVEILNAMSEEQLNHTAVVFADESLLVPFVHAFGHEMCNITMSYPARHTHAFHLFQDLMTAAQNFRRLNHLDGNGKPAANAGYYHKDVMAILQNPLLLQALLPLDSAKRKAETQLLNLNHIFISRDEISEVLSEKFPDLSVEGLAFIPVLIDFLTLIASKLDDDPENVEREILYVLISELQKVNDLLASFTDLPMDFRTITTFVDEAVGTLGIPFIGNPSKGLQLMGLLETRTLDFENVIILSVNEGTVPAGKSSDSLLLFELKHHFGLPTYEHKDTTYAYHFFRLLQRASTIHLIYDMDASTSANEESRFIRQLEYEVQHQKLGDSVKVCRHKISVQPKLSAENQGISIVKTEETIAKLKKMPYSASTLADYINCPLQFYLKHVAEILPEKTIDENIEQNVIGTVMHKIMQDLAEEIIAKPNDYAQIIDQYEHKINDETYLRDTFWQIDVIKNQDITHGKLLLAVEVVKRQLHKYFQYFRKELENPGLGIRLIQPEMKIIYEVPVGKDFMSFKGYADLIEERAGKTAILDYKTGRIHDMRFTEMAEVFADTNKSQLRQLLTYAYLYWKKNDVAPEDITCALIGFQALMAGENHFFAPTRSREDGKRGVEPLPITKELLDDFEKALQELFMDILDVENPFVQTANPTHCQWCDYKSVCSMKA